LISMLAASTLPEVAAVLLSGGGPTCAHACMHACTHTHNLQPSQVTNQIIKGVGQMVETFGSEYAPYRGYGRCVCFANPTTPPPHRLGSFTPG